MNKEVSQFPVQKLTMVKKTEEWGKDCVEYIIGEFGVSNTDELPNDEEIQSLYDLYNSLYDEKKLKYVTNPFNQEDGFPAAAQDYNIIRPKIDLLIGEETKRPFNFKVCRTSEIGSSDLQDKAKDLLMDYAMANIASKLGPEEAMRYQQALETGEIMTPEQIQKYLAKDYKDIAETTAYYSLDYLRKKLNLDHEFMKGWRDALIAGMEYYYIGIRNGEPYAEVINPKDFKYFCGEGVEFVHDAERCCRKMRTTVSQLYDMLYDRLKESDLDDLLRDVEGMNGHDYGSSKGKSIRDDYNHNRVGIVTNNTDTSKEGEIDLYHCCWRSYKKIGFVTIFDPETNMPVEIQVDEYYDKTGDELNIEWKWIVEIWEGYKAGDDKYFGIAPIEYQYIDETLNSQKLPYTGVAYSNANTKAKSLVSIMEPLQYMYIILWYRLELAIARDKGKVINVDITQIPKSMGIDPAKWLHYISALGINFINPYEEGWDIPGRNGGNPAPFNQMTAMDAGMSNTIVTYIQLMDKIENMLSEISGVTPQRLGAISSNELVGNVERSVVQSAHITEPLFWLHNQVKKNVMTMLLDTAKYAWSKSEKKYLHYIFDDATRAFLELSDEFPYETYDIFVSDSTKENRIIDEIKQLIQPAMQNGASLMDVIDILTTDNVSILKQKMEEIEANRIAREQALQDQQFQQQQQIAQIEQQTREQALMLDQAKLDMEKYKIDTDATTRITVAQLNAYRGSENMDQNDNGIPDPIEIANTAIAEQKASADIASKTFDLANKAREAEFKRNIEDRKISAQEKADKQKSEIERRKIALEEKKLKANERLQRIKDQAAMEREKLKAKTALRNKVPGEK